MKKWKIFFSILKERDWLEAMARQGYILTDINLGIRYHFKKSEPCEKVFEIERFAISSQPTVSELTAKKLAIDIATQSGWELVTNDEEMNYYFIKDKAGDETDEFYDDDSRQERAERYRKRYVYDAPMSMLNGSLFFSAVYFILFLLNYSDNNTLVGLMWFYFVLATLDILLVWFTMRMGNNMHKELMMSRDEWDYYKNHSQKRSFKKVQQLRVFLQEQSEKGLGLVGFKDNRYVFEKDNRRYNYFVDTSSCLKKRLKAQGRHFKHDKKDWLSLGLKWFEASIEDAAQYNLKPIAVIGNNIIIYRRPFSDDKIPWENGNENFNITQIANPMILGFVAGCCIVGFIIGFVIGICAL